jgi:hypothetical protein
MGRSAHCTSQEAAVPCPPVSAQPTTNLDLLQWFREDERNVCSTCGERACVSLPEVAAHFCLACGAIHIAGMRVDIAGRIAV